MTSPFERTLLAALSRWSLSISSDQVAQLRAHYQTVVEVNRTMNLTRIVEPADAAVKHYADSLALSLWARERKIAPASMLDIGTGAGFPAVPLAVVHPHWAVTAIDAARKKVEFLKQATRAIGLSNLHVEHAHSRHWVCERTFPIVALRAVARLPSALLHAARHVAPGGWFVCYQTASAAESALEDVRELSLPAGFDVPLVYAYTLQTAQETVRRALLIFPKAP